jgi:CheY-like chemotaxis protein
VGKGTGLGLASVFGTIQQHNGAISCHNLPEGGSCFRLLLPLTREEASFSIASSIEEEKGTGTILLVEDEETLRITTQAMLQRLGYSVLLANNGRQALKIFSANPMLIDLVLLDMIMPTMNGRDCFEALQKMNPNVKAIMISGFAENADIARMKAAGLLDFLAKPYSSDELSHKIHEALS